MAVDDTDYLRSSQLTNANELLLARPARCLNGPDDLDQKRNHLPLFAYP